MDDIQFIDVDPDTRVVKFILKPKKVRGISKLIQIIVYSLLNTPGRDVLDPDKGGGMLDLLNSNIDPNDSNEVFADVVRRIKKSESEIIKDQIGVNDPPEEKLSELQIVDLQRGEQIDEISVRIRVVNQAGQASDIVV